VGRILGSDTDRKCILVVGFDENEEPKVRRGFEPSVQLPVRFIRSRTHAIQCLRESISANHDFPALLLLNLRRSDWDGFYFLAWVREQAALRETIIVVCGAECTEEDWKHACAIRVDCCLHKLADLEDVMRLLMQVEEHWFSPVRMG
jgi:hypothetical protein